MDSWLAGWVGKKQMMVSKNIVYMYKIVISISGTTIEQLVAVTPGRNFRGIAREERVSPATIFTFTRS